MFSLALDQLLTPLPCLAFPNEYGNDDGADDAADDDDEDDDKSGNNICKMMMLLLMTMMSLPTKVVQTFQAKHRILVGKAFVMKRFSARGRGKSAGIHKFFSNMTIVQ